MGAGHDLLSSYERLAELAQRELELVEAGELDELAPMLDELTPVLEERDALVATLPAVPPQAARPALERAAELRTRITAALAQGMRDATSELDRLHRGRATVRSYTGPDAAPRKRVDHAA